MSREGKSRPSATGGVRGPVQPGSPLYRMLELIAKEIAKVLQHQSPKDGGRRPKR